MRASSTSTIAPGLHCRSAARNSRLYPVAHMRLPRRSQAQEQHPRPAAARSADDVTEIKIEGDEYSIVGNGLCEYLVIAGRFQSNFAHMHGVVPLASQPIAYRRRQVHIEQKAHRRLDRSDLLARQPRRIRECLANVLRFEVGIVPQDLVTRDALRDQPDNQPDGDAQASYASATTHLAGLEGNPIQTAQDGRRWLRFALSRHLGARLSVRSTRSI